MMQDKWFSTSAVVPRFAREMQILRQMAPAGFYVGLRIGFIAPEIELNMLPASLTRSYSAQGMAPNDPLMRWASRNGGAIRWADLATSDPAGILAEYRRHGLQHGIALSIVPSAEDPVRSLGLFGRSDRDFEDAEMILIGEVLDRMHRPAASLLTDRQIEVLKLIAAGHRYKNVAQILGISESAVKARLKTAVLRTGARTAAQAVRLATSSGLLGLDPDEERTIRRNTPGRKGPGSGRI